MNNLFSLKNKLCFITAAGQGIGRETALTFAKLGAKVIATDINEQALKSLQEENSDIQIEVLDVTNTEQIKDLISKIDKIDVLFNCAGWVPAGDILTCTSSDWQRAFDINVSSMFHIIQEILPKMLSNNGGSIINMSSVASSVKGVPNRFAYTVTKAAIVGLTKSIASDYVSKGIRCNAICPGTVQTPSLDERIEAQAKLEHRTFEEVYAQFVARQPMGRVAKVQEVASLVAYLASDASGFTTGTCQVIDGGWSN